MGLKISSYEQFETYIGKELGVSEYVQVDQARINAFAEATLDHQWIHTDPERAAKETEFGTTIAHGYLTLSMAPYLLGQIIELDNLKMGVNYGVDKLRFMSPVKCDSRVRMRAELSEMKNLRGTARAKIKITIEIEGVDKAACVGEVTYLYQFAD
ncbi:MAG: MaoC family dehydratase [bacterium]|nr:MaoC family dehydratase [bacterium]